MVNETVIKKRIRLYRLLNGRVPYLDWSERLRDLTARQKVEARINRARMGNLGCARSVGAGISELIINYGPGYRVYFGQDGDELVVLLCGGDKSTQDEDIKKAKEYWQIYKQEKTYVEYC